MDDGGFVLVGSKKRVKYRYILSGIVESGMRIDEFRLVSGIRLGTKEHGSVIVRVEIPEDMVLEKWSSDAYSKAVDARLLSDLTVEVLKWNGYTNRWEKTGAELSELRDLREDGILEYAKYVNDSKVRDREYSESLLTIDRFDGGFSEVELFIGDDVLFGYYTPYRIAGVLGNREMDAWLSTFNKFSFIGDVRTSFRGIIETHDLYNGDGTLLFVADIGYYFDKYDSIKVMPKIELMDKGFGYLHFLKRETL